MTDRKNEITSYLPGEGRDFMHECLRHAFEWSKDNGITAIVIFTGTGEGPLYAVQNLMTESGIETVVAVTPPAGRAYRVDPRNQESEVVRAGVDPKLRQFLEEMGVGVIAAHLPFKPIEGLSGSSQWEAVEAALSIMGGGFPLCIQAALVACDAGAVAPGDRIVVATADTAISVVACRTETFISKTRGLLVEHVICRPRKFDISKADHDHSDALWSHEHGLIDVIGHQAALPPKEEPTD